jgi:hypothetical protein
MKRGENLLVCKISSRAEKDEGIGELASIVVLEIPWIFGA